MLTLPHETIYHRFLCGFPSTFDLHGWWLTFYLMKAKTNISPEETLDWLVSLATADGCITASEQTVILDFAASYNLNGDIAIARANAIAGDMHPEVEKIDYRSRNGMLFEKLIVSLLADKNRFKLLSWTGDKFVNGIYDDTNLDPDLHIRQRINDFDVDYYIECKWHHFWQKGEKDYIFEMRPYQLARYRRFQRSNKRKVLVAYAYGRTGDNPRGIYLIPLYAFHNCRITKSVADAKYRIEANADAFTAYMEQYFEAVFYHK